MKNIMTVAAVAAFALALTACGGGSGGDNGSPSLSRADEGIWSNVDGKNGNTMQAVILSDGSYWGIAGQDYGISMIPASSAEICIVDVMNGTATVNGSDASGAYAAGFDLTSGTVINGTYSGTVSAQNSLDLAFDSPLPPFLTDSYQMRYDSIYNQPASLSAIAGIYLDRTAFYCGPGGGPAVRPPPDNTPYPVLVIAGSNLLMKYPNGVVMMEGTIAPHGTTVNVFDVSLTTTVALRNMLPGKVYKGILFRASFDIQRNNIEMIVAAEQGPFAYIGNKQ